MLARNFRLTAEKDYARIFSKGRPFHGRGMGMKAVRNQLDTPRIGFVVSTKVSKKAVVRNQVKRRMREIVRKQLQTMIGGVDIVFMARPDSTKMTYADLERAMTDIMSKAGLYKKP